MTHHTDADRAEFEAWMASTGPRFDTTDRKPDGRYWSSHTHLMWEAWRAARRAPAAPVLQVSIEKLEEWKRRVNTLATCSLKADRYRVGSALKQDIADAIAAHGIGDPS